MTAEAPRSAAPELPTAPASPQVDPEPTLTTNGPETANLCSCGHRVMWHHDTRGCGYFGYSEGARCSCRLDSDAAVESLIAARVDAALAPVRELVDGPIGTRDEPGRWNEHGAWIRGARHLRIALRAALDRQEDHR